MDRIKEFNILYSTDYELFFGRNTASEKEILIDTTERLMHCCESQNIPLTVFCDISCVWRYQELGMNEFPDLVKSQCIETVKRGHDVQAHLHPHWFRAERRADQWAYSSDTFLVGRWGSSDEECGEIAADWLRRAKTDLEKWICPSHAGYRCVAFRAGGYGFQPREHILLQALLNAGYLIDSTICPGMQHSSNNNQINYVHVPSDSNSLLAPESGITQPSLSGIFEIPIATGQMPAFDFAIELLIKGKQKVGRKLAGITEDDSWRSRGLGALESQSAGVRHKLVQRLRSRVSRFKRRWNCLSLLPGSDPDIMFRIAKNYLNSRVGKTDQPIFFGAITHSKTITSTQLRCLSIFHKKMQRHYGSAFCSVHYRDVADYLATH